MRLQTGTMGVSTPAHIYDQNVAGRTLVGLRFWNQVCRLRILRLRFRIEGGRRTGGR